jgi:hypothetical protein
MAMLRGDPALTIHHEHSHTRHQELIEAMQDALKQTKARVVEHDKLPAPEARDHSEKNAR